MTRRLEIYTCAICNNIIEVFEIASGGTLSCCGHVMQLSSEQSGGTLSGMHVPVITTSNGQVTVNVGSVAHPMEENHFIKWIEVIDGSKVYRRTLTPGETPEVTFQVTENIITARIFCNLHGHWRSAS